MLQIHGPTYRYQGEILESSQIILVEDHHYNEQDQCDHLSKLLLSSNHQHTVIFDHVVQQDIFDFECVYFPKLLAREADEFIQEEITTCWTNKTRAFNFMINKPRVHRNMLLQLIESFKLENFCHSLAWKSNPVNFIPVTNYQFGDEVVLEQGVKNGNHKNSLTYNKLLKINVFEPSCVSLITEPVFFERETVITEKTIMAIYGGTIPIWVGGWRIPEYMQTIGFDIFEDIVDHSYQSLNDPEQRCRLAVARNLHLLNDLILVDPARLQNNLNLVKSNPWLTQVNSLIKIYPDLRTVWPA